MSHRDVVEKCRRGSKKFLADVNEPRSKGCGVGEAPRSRRGGETWGTQLRPRFRFVRMTGVVNEREGSQNPSRSGFVESHLCAKGAQRWATRECSSLRKGGT